jgi:DMSO reductase anchor subunit
MKRVPTLAAVLTLVLLAYAWWATGVRPFTTLAYVLIAIPSLLAVSIYALLGGLSPRADVTAYYRRRSAGATPKSIGPWTGLLLVAVVLEVIGLALGGRSPNVATLSTTVDHMLVAHWGRWLLYDLWLAVGVGPLERLRQARPGDA